MQLGSGSKAARVNFKQSLAHFEYLFYVFLKLSHYCSSYPSVVKTKIKVQESKFIDKRKLFFGISFYTRSLPCLFDLYTLFYVNKVKVVPYNLFDLLNYEVLAYWIMSDGTRNHGGLTLQVQSYTILEVNFIINCFIIKFDIDCSMHFQRRQPVIYIKAKSVRKLKPFIEPYFLNSMKYKLNK